MLTNEKFDDKNDIKEHRLITLNAITCCRRNKNRGVNIIIQIQMYKLYNRLRSLYQKLKVRPVAGILFRLGTKWNNSL